MPVWMRKFHIGKINEFNEKQKAEMDKQQGQSNIGDNQLSRPNINPSSTYNISK